MGPTASLTKESGLFADKSARWILLGKWMAGGILLKAEQFLFVGLHSWLFPLVEL